MSVSTIHRAARPSRILGLASVACLLLFIVSAEPSSAATTVPVKVGGVFSGSPLAQGGVVWFNGYDPETIVIRPGDTVQWTLIGGIHTVTSTELKDATAFAFDSSPDFPAAAALGDLSPGRLLAPGSVYENNTNFLDPGTYRVLCKIHPGMMGNLTVTIAPPVGVVDVDAGWGDPVYAVQAFRPENVVVPRGTIVRWTLTNPTEPHTITGFNSTGSLAWDSSPLITGEPPVMGAMGQVNVFNWTFANEGTFTYFCKLHAYKIGESWVGMTGTIVVEKARNEVIEYAGLGIGITALLIALGAVGLARRRGGGGAPPPNP